MKRMIGFRTVLWALGLSIAAVVVLWFGWIFDIWPSGGFIPVILLFAIPLSLMLFVFLVHREQEQSKNKRQENDFSR